MLSMFPSCPSISLFSTQEPAPQNYPLVHIPLRGKRKFFKRPLPLTPRPSHYGLPVTKPSCPHLFPLYLYFLSPLSGIPFAQVHTWPLSQYLQISERTSLPSLSKTAPHLPLSLFPCYFSSQHLPPPDTGISVNIHLY